MDEPPRTQEREFFRLWYPQAERPTLEIGNQKFEVAEISEEGARIVLSGPFTHDSGESFKGFVRFNDGESDSVEGVVLRVSDSEVVANLKHGVSLKRMISEQVRLRASYPSPPRSSEDWSGKAEG
ncbi:MAG: PilZ domain-containing protein [Rhodopirellula sp.]|nr:PilZ domain-containing protein [Rhodopirellula sp.]